MVIIPQYVEKYENMFFLYPLGSVMFGFRNNDGITMADIP